MNAEEAQTFVKESHHQNVKLIAVLPHSNENLSDDASREVELIKKEPETFKNIIISQNGLDGAKELSNSLIAML